MTVQDTQSAALLAHVISQVESNVQFLVSQSYISHSDASTILSKLPKVSASPQPHSVSAVNNQRAVPAPPPRAVASPSTARPVQARALWAYQNKEDHSGEDLSFKEGDIIDIVEETNEHWWVGRVNGKQGLFPANYVEKITVAEKVPYRPFGAAYHGMDAPPPAGTGVNTVGLQEVDQSKKKSKFGGLGNTMAHSAAGGVGFGAGAAIGSGIVNAIF
ncbi:hypothetical protein AX16_002347 [Volvariella volvacea WC 439]|nr:hypothetical protein AX16_002347 [Volvariella volvacea WC 439]